MNRDELAHAMMAAMNRLAKWRTVFTGWQLGTRSKEDPEAQAVSDTREAIMLLRAEVSALSNLLIEANVFTFERFATQIITECDELERLYEKKFPGFKATDFGLNVNTQLAAETTKTWPT